MQGNEDTGVGRDLWSKREITRSFRDLEVV